MSKDEEFFDENKESLFLISDYHYQMIEILRNAQPSTKQIILNYVDYIMVNEMGCKFEDLPWVNKKENNKEEEYYRMLRLKAVKKAIIITKQLNMRLH